MKLRSHLIVLIVSTLLPVLAFTGLMIFRFWRQQRAIVEDSLLETARAVSLAVDREVIAWTSALEALGTSKDLDSGDLRSFYEAAQRVLKTRDDWNNILLTDAAGRQLLNLLLPLGAPLPAVRQLEQFQQTIASSRPVVSDLFLGRISRTPLIGVSVPVSRQGKIRYVLASSAPPDCLSRILAQQRMAPDWMATIMDRRGLVLAPPRGATELVGKSATLLVGAPTEGASQGLWRATDRNGTRLQVVTERSTLTGWSVHIVIPVSILEAPLRRSLLATVGGGTLLLLGAVGLAILFGRRIAGPINDLSLAAVALGRGELPETAPSPIIEVSQVAKQIQEAAVRRNEAETELNRANDALKGEVVERTQTQRRIEALYEISRAVNSTLDLRGVLNILAEKIFFFLPDSSGLVRLLDRETGELEPVARWNLAPQEFDNYHKSRGSGLARAAFEADEPLLIENVEKDPRTRDPDFARRNDIRRFLGFRLMAKGEKLGVIAFNLRGAHGPSGAEIEFLRTLAEHAAIAIHNAQLHESLSHQAAALVHANDEAHGNLESLQALYRVASSLNESLQAGPVIHNAVREIAAIFRFEATRVFLYNRGKDELHLFSSYEANPNLWARVNVFRKGEGILGRVCDTGEPIVFEDVRGDPRYRELSQSKAADAAGYGFFALYPIQSKAETLGAMVFIGRSPRRLEPYEDILIRSIAEQIGVALQNAELVRRLEWSLDHARALHDVGLAVNSNLDLQVVLNVLFEHADRVIPHAAAEIRLLNKETGVLEATACRNLDVNEWKAVRAGRGLAKVVLDTKAPLAVRDMRRDPRTANPEFMRRESLLSFLGVPLTVMDEVIGCFIVMTREEHDFAGEEIELFSALANQAAVAIHKARLYEHVKKQAEALSEANAELKRHTLEQGVVAHLGNLALGGVDLQSLMDEAVVLVAQTLQVEYAKVLELLPGGHALALRAGVGWKEGLVGQATVGVEHDSQAGYTLLTYEPVVVEDLSTETRFSGPALLREHGVVSGLSAVIYGKNGAYGVLGAHSTKRRAFTREQVAFVQTVANLLATAIERKRAEEALRASEERFSLAAKATNDAMWEWNMVTGEVWWNEGPVILFRYSPADVKPDLTWWSERIHPEDRSRITASVNTAVKTGQQTWRDEYRFLRGDGSHAYVVDRGYVLYDEQGKPTRMIGCMTDITGRRESELALKNSRAQLRAFAANLQAAREEERTTVAREIHDELGQTLTGLKMDLSWLRKKLPKDQEVLLEKADAMLGLMNDTIDTVRRISTELRPGVLDELGLSAAVEWQAREFEKRTGIRCGLDSSVNDGGLDKTRSTALFRIFQEALTNIARHANATRVGVRLDQNNGHLKLQVRDNGGGIRKSKLSDPQSLGILGMRERAMLVGGELAITRARGKGTTVTVKIPIAAEEKGSRGERGQGRKGDRGQR